jgi:hypothetical protein
MSEYYQSLYEILVGEDSVRHFLFLCFLRKNNYMFLHALIKLRQHIRKTRIVDYDLILNNIGETIIESKEIMEKLFLHPIFPKMKLDEKMNRQGWTIEKIIKMHPKYPNMSLTELLNRPYQEN